MSGVEKKEGAKSGLFRHTLLYMPAQLLGPLLQFATTIIWTHQLNPVDYGIVTFVVAAQELTGFVGLSWWTVYVMRFSARHREAGAGADLRAMDNRMVLFGALLQCLFAAPVLLSFQHLDHPALFAATVCYLVLRTLLMHYAEWARARTQIGLYTAAQIIGPAGGALFSMGFIHFTQGGATAGLAGLALGPARGGGVRSARLGVPLSFGRFNRATGLSALRFGAPLAVAAFSAWLAANGARLLVQWTEGNEAVGIFSVGWGLGQRIATVLAMLCAAAAFPLAVKQLEGGDRDGAVQNVGLNGALMFGIVAPAAAGLSLLAGPFAEVLIAPAYRAATEVILPIAFIAMGLKTIKIHTIDQTALLLERSGVVMRLNMMEAATTVFGCSLGLLADGIVGAAYGALAGVVVGVAIAVAYAYVSLGLRFPHGLLARISLACGLMTLALLFLPKPDDLVSLVLTIAAGGFAYAAGLILVIPALRRALLARMSRA